jgi:hypothetical protein
MRIHTRLAVAFVLAAAPLFSQDNPWAPDVAEPGSVEKIRQYTTAPEYLPSTVAYVPDSPTVPSPADVLGRISGTPNELSKVSQIHDYFRRLDAASPRVQVQTIGRTEEGRDLILAAISDEANLADLARFKDITRRLADPRISSRADAERLAAEGKAVYHLLGGLHSPETGSPEMLMELAYRLAVSERPEIQNIRRNLIVLITPVAEPDGRDRQVEWYYRHLRNRKLTYEELREFSSPPYWGHYVFHDNNRDGMQLTLALTRAINDVFWDFHPQIVHDLHESVPLLYISSGHGPYSRAVDPVSINEWTQFAHHEAGALQSLGLPGVWTWGFWDGWWPGYLFSVANNHNATGRFYETFGNSLAGTFERRLEEDRYAGRPVTEVQWYRPWPPDKTVKWSLRNNTNFMQAGVLEALGYAAAHRSELLQNFWTKGDRAITRGKGQAPYAWIFLEKQRDPGRLAYLVNQLMKHRIEVHRLSAELKLGDTAYPAGTYVVRMDQPYRNAAINFLENQKFPEEEPNQPYDDVAWTWPLLYGAEGKQIDDKKVLDARMTAVAQPLAPEGRIEGSGGVFVMADTGQNGLIEARLALPGRIEAVEEEFRDGDRTFPPGSWIFSAPRGQLSEIASRLGLNISAIGSLPTVKRHTIELPRLAVMHTWSTQNVGWVRYTFDQIRLPYTLINPDDLRRGNLLNRFDVIIFPNSGGDLARMVHGIDRKYGPIAYTKTAEFPSHGTPDSSPDLTGGMGFEGLGNLQRFVQDGGVFVALANSGTLAVDGGLVRGVTRVAQPSFSTPGSELLAKVVNRAHPITYGYEEFTSVFRGGGPIFDIRARERDRVVLQFGSKKVEVEPESVELSIRQESPAPATEPSAPATEPPAEKTQPEKEDKKDLVLSGFVRGKDVVDGKPAILDIPSGRGRVVLFNFNPMHRYLNHSDFRFVYNVILNWNDLP